MVPGDGTGELVIRVGDGFAGEVAGRIQGVSNTVTQTVGDAGEAVGGIVGVGEGVAVRVGEGVELADGGVGITGGVSGAGVFGELSAGVVGQAGDDAIGIAAFEEASGAIVGGVGGGASGGVGNGQPVTQGMRGCCSRRIGVGECLSVRGALSEHFAVDVVGPLGDLGFADRSGTEAFAAVRISRGLLDLFAQDGNGEVARRCRGHR